jgi:hypothetical protein
MAAMTEPRKAATTANPRRLCQNVSDRGPKLRPNGASWKNEMIGPIEFSRNISSPGRGNHVGNQTRSRACQLLLRKGKWRCTLAVDSKAIGAV